MEGALKIPWVKFVWGFMNDLGHPDYFTNPSAMLVTSRKALKKEGLQLLDTIRLAGEIQKPSVKQHQLTLTTLGMEPYLSFAPGGFDRFLLTRFRLGNVHRLMTFPTMNDWSRNLPPCPCDKCSAQSTIHIVLFCKCYIELRKVWIIPLLKYRGLRQCRPALITLQLLENKHIAWRIAMFLKRVLQQRKSMLIG